MADFLLGNLRQSTVAVAVAYANNVRNVESGYVDDTYKFSPKVTISTCLRYELTPPWKRHVRQQFQRAPSGEPRSWAIRARLIRRAKIPTMCVRAIAHPPTSIRGSQSDEQPARQSAATAWCRTGHYCILTTLILLRALGSLTRRASGWSYAPATAFSTTRILEMHTSTWHVTSPVRCQLQTRTPPLSGAPPT